MSPRPHLFARAVLAALCLPLACSRGAPKDGPTPTSAPIAAPVVLESTAIGEGLLAQARAKFRVTVDGASRPVLGEAHLGAVTTDGRTLHARPAGVRATGTAKVAAVDVVLPKLADGTIEVRSTVSSLAVRVRPVGFAARPVEWAEHIAVHPGVQPGVDLFRVVQATGVEDFYQVASERDELVFEQQIALEHVAGLRLVADTLELLDAQGNPLVRATPPRAFDAAGATRAGRLRVLGCRYDEDPRGPWRRPVVPPGADTCRVVASVDGRGLAYPVLFDPTWQATSTTKQTHAYHQLHLLRGGPDKGKVLLVNGTGSFPGVTEMLDPSATPRTWASASSFPGVVTLGMGSSSVALADGTVVALGGAPTTGSSSCQATVVVRDPTTGVWSPGAAMAAARCYAAATSTIVDGKELVLVAGGQSGSGSSSSFPPIRGAQLYDPGTDAWTSLAGLSTARARHRAVRLGDGRVLVAGGEDYDPSTFVTTPLSSAEIWSPTTKAFAAAADLNVRRTGGELVALPPAGGKPYAVFAGGSQTTSYTGIVDTLEVFDGTKWTLLSARLGQPRQHFASALLDDGRVLFTGGYSYGPTFGITAAEGGDLFVPGTDPTTGSVVAAPSMASRRWFHAMVSLPGHGALVTGGLETTAALGAEITSSEVYETTLGGACSAGCLSGLACVDGVCCATPSCPTGQKCNNPGREGVCTKPKGDTCASNAECASGYCVGGVCCDSACSGGCSTCTEAGSVGTCKWVALGTDPAKFCGTDPYCSRKCDGTGKCLSTFPGAGTACSTSAGDAGTGPFCVAYACNGFGSCLSKANDCGLSCTTTVTCDESTRTCTPNAAGIKAGRCLIEGKCWALGDLDPKDSCRVCDPPTSKVTWTPSPDVSCSDAGVDAGLDTGLVDTGVDTGLVDTGTGLFDTGAPDTGTGTLDTGTLDTGTPDSGAADAVPDGAGDDAGPEGESDGSGCSVGPRSSHRAVPVGLVLGLFALHRVLRSAQRRAVRGAPRS